MDLDNPDWKPDIVKLESELILDDHAENYDSFTASRFEASSCIPNSIFMEKGSGDPEQISVSTGSGLSLHQGVTIKTEITEDSTPTEDPFEDAGCWNLPIISSTGDHKIGNGIVFKSETNFMDGNIMIKKEHPQLFCAENNEEAEFEEMTVDCRQHLVPETFMSPLEKRCPVFQEEETNFSAASSSPSKQCFSPFEFDVDSRSRMVIHHQKTSVSRDCPWNGVENSTIQDNIGTMSSPSHLSAQHCSAQFNPTSAVQLHSEIAQCSPVDKLIKYEDGIPLDSDQFVDKIAGIIIQIPNFNTAKNFSCKRCFALFKTKKGLQVHMLVHSKDKNFSCRICHEQYDQKLVFQKHLATHLNNLSSHSDEKPSSSKRCSPHFKKIEFMNHSLVHSGSISDNAKNFSCKRCSALCVTKEGLQKHMRVHSKDKNFSCRICHEQYDQKLVFQKHLATHLNNLSSHSDEKPSSSKRCSPHLKKIEIMNHSLVHSGSISDNAKNFSCKRCSALCVTKEGLQKHMRVHFNDKNFFCNKCHAQYDSKSTFQKHLATHFDEKLFSCNHCSYTCKQQQIFQMHLQLHLSDKRYTCSQCSAGFKTKKILKKHLRVHKNVEPFSCNQCSARFRTKLKLKRHSVVHPLCCNQCSATFKRSSQLQIHLLVHMIKKSLSHK